MLFRILFGILNFFKGSPKDVIEFIAMQNWVYYRTLKEHFNDVFEDEDEILKLTAYLSCEHHIDEGVFSVKDMNDSLGHAQRGYCCLDFRKARHETTIANEDDLFLSLTVQVVAMVLYGTLKKTKGGDIIDEVIDRKSNLAKVVNIAKEKYFSGNDFPPKEKTLAKLKEFMASDKFIEVLKEIRELSAPEKEDEKV